MKKLVAFVLTFALVFVFFACSKKNEDETIAPTGLKVTLEETEIAVGDTVTAKAKITPDNATDKTVKWSSDNEAVATVNSKGLITAVSEGTAKITAVSNAASNVTGSVTVTVVAGSQPTPTPTPGPGPTPTPTPTEDKVYVEKIIFLASALSAFYVGDTTRFGLSFNDANPDKRPTDTSVTYESSDEAIATVAENGTITFLAAGEVTITVYAVGVEPGKEGTIKDSVTLTVEDLVAPTSFTATIPNANNTIKPGTGSKIIIEVEPANGDRHATFASSDESIATVDENGNISTFSGVQGTVTITVTSVAVPSFVVEIVVKVEEETEVLAPESVTITGAEEMFVGDAYSVRLIAVVSPATADQRVIWSSNNESVATVTQDGLVTGLSVGTARIRATSYVDESVKSSYFTIKVSEYVAHEAVDLKGYNIIIMNAASALSDIDPFLEAYSQSDKTYKQEAWREVEQEFNCTISVVAYPEEAPWGDVRVKWIIDNATNGTSQCDLGTISSNWLYRFANASAGVDVSEYYGKYGESQMEQALKECGSFKQKLYVASTGISPTATYVDFGLYYNMALVEKCNLADPAKMFNDGEWTYTNFMKWVRDGQAALGDQEGAYALAGHPYYYWFGLTNAAGIKVADTTNVKVYLSTSAQKEAALMYRTLYEEGCVDHVGSWCESSSDGNAWFQGKALMTSGYLWFVRSSSRWMDNLFGEDTRYGYVPYPYPDGMDKDATRISQSGLSVYLYCAGRQYPAGVSIEGIYQAVNEMYLRTIRKEKADPLFDADETITNTLKKRIDNPESIEAIKFFTAAKVFFDPAHGLYTSTSATPLKTPCVQYMFAQVETYDEVFDAVYSQYTTDFYNIYGG